MKAIPVVGILGGTFDPVHLGHLEMAERALRSMELERMLLLPSAIPPHKSRPRLTPARHRMAMLRLAIEGRESFEISSLELETVAVCYTIDTLRRLRVGPPPVHPVFVLGTDSLADLRTWRDYQSLAREFDLAVLDRPGKELAEVCRLLPPEIAGALVVVAEGRRGKSMVREARPGRGGRIFHIPMKPNPVSSSQVRDLASAGRSLDGLVPPAVAGYIQRNGLYRQEDRR